MQLCQVLLSWLSLVIAASAAHEQEVIGNGHVNRHNLTLHFDDLATNASGIGHPATNSTPLHISDLYFQSFTVVNVVKAMKNLPDPVDILCAASAPNALFSHRRAGYPWPRFSLHSLTDPKHERDPNVTFTMRSVRVSPTGRIPDDSLVLLWLNLLKLPPDESFGKEAKPLPYPELVRGAPTYAEGRFNQIIAFFGPGPHASIRVDWEFFRQRGLPELGTKVDTFEVYGDLLEREGPNEPYKPVGDWEVCLDDVAVEVVRKVGGDEEDEDGESSGGFERVFVFAGEDGGVVNDQERGERLMKELGL